MLPQNRFPLEILIRHWYTTTSFPIIPRNNQTENEENWPIISVFILSYETLFYLVICNLCWWQYLNDNQICIAYKNTLYDTPQEWKLSDAN